MFKLNMGYEKPDLGDGDGANPYKGRELDIAKWTGELLNKHHPGYPWNVRVVIQGRDGVIMIQLLAVMPSDRWYVVKVNDAFHDVGGKRTVLQGAGELLERYQLPRPSFSLDDWRGALTLVKNPGRGNIAPLHA